jgi:molecular chaperone GrpE (heat shock protein)
MERQGGEKRSFYQRGKGASTDTNKFAGVVGTSITLVAALVMLFASLAALLLANSLRGQLQETQDQLKEAQGKLQDAQSELQNTQAAKDRQQKTDKAGAGPAAGKQPGAVNKSQPQENTKGRSQNSKSSTQGGQDQQLKGEQETLDARGQQQMVLVSMQEDGGSSVPYLLLLALGLVTLSSLALVVVSALTLRFGGSRSGKLEARSGASATSPTETSNLGRASSQEDGPWMKLVEECVEVVDELDEHMGSFDAPRREVAGHVILRFEEILRRSGVEVISDDAIFDRARHKPDANHAATEDGAAVSKTMSPGFVVGSRVLRRARVRLE